MRNEIQAGSTLSKSEAIITRLIRLAFSDKRFTSYQGAIGEVEAEMQELMQLPGPFADGTQATTLKESLESRRGQLIKGAGALLGHKLREELKFLQGLRSALVRIRFEITKMEKTADEASLKGEDITVPKEDYDFTTATDDERSYWPFEGEYWRDELGTYEYTLTRGCKPPDEAESE
jgi:hypothetical protein